MMVQRTLCDQSSAGIGSSRDDQLGRIWEAEVRVGVAELQNCRELIAVAVSMETSTEANFRSDDTTSSQLQLHFGDM
jgi:hypothetical protein